MTGFASNVSEGSLCLYSYPLKNPETILVVLNHVFIYYEVSKLVIKGTGEAVRVVFKGQKILLVPIKNVFGEVFYSCFTLALTLYSS